MQNVEETIRSYIAENILFNGDGYPYTDDASFLSEDIIDSMNVLELVTFVEETFGVVVQDEEIVPENFDSVSKLAGFVRRKLPLVGPHTSFDERSCDCGAVRQPVKTRVGKH